MKKLLFVTPVMPSNTKGGREIRAYNALLIYAKTYEITLITYNDDEIPGEVAVLISHYFCVNKRKLFEDVLKKIFRRLPDYVKKYFSPSLNFANDIPIKNASLIQKIIMDDFEIIHVFRLYTLVWLMSHSIHIKKNMLVLDVDDIESTTYERIAKLAYSREIGVSHYYQQLSNVYRKYEDEWIPKVHKIQVCSELDKNEMLLRYSALSIEVVVNRYAINEKISEIPFNSEIKRILFVGSMGYIPNQDAVDYFCKSILPLLRERSNYTYQIDIVGAAMPVFLKKRLEAIKGVTCHGYQSQLDEFYASANLVVCPIRAGGGTRIKILEAISYARPVVTTQMGKEGLVFTDNELALAGSPTEFFNKIIQILEDKTYANSLTINAMKVFKMHYQSPII